MAKCPKLSRFMSLRSPPPGTPPCSESQAKVLPFRQEKEAPTQTFWSEYLPVGWGFFHVNGWGPKSLACPSKCRESKLLGGISQGCPKSWRGKKGGSFFTYSWNFFGYSPLRCFLDTLSHCKQRSLLVSKNSNCKQKNSQTQL